VVVKSFTLLLSLCCVAFIPELPSRSVLFLLVVLFVFLTVFLAALQTDFQRIDLLESRLKWLTVPVAVFVFGFVYGCLNASWHLSRHLPAELLGVEVEIVATVIDLPHHNGRRLRFLSRLESVRALESDVPLLRSGRVRLSWYGNNVPDLKAGDKVKLTVKLKEPSGFMNPGGFDLERWLIQNKIVATGYVRSKSFDISQSVISNSLTPVSSIRNMLQRRLMDASEGLSSQGVILALSVGDRSGVTGELWDRFFSTGTNHLLAISGLHISLVAGFFVLLVQSMWRCTGLSGKSTRRGCALAAALGAAFCYSAMAGFSIPTVRALMMFAVLVCLLLLRRHQRRTQSLAIALIVVCLLDPLSVLAPGFWMSFAAVAVLFLVFSNSETKGRVAFFTRLLRGHVLVSVGLYPLTLLFFGQASLVAPIANLLVTPLVGLLVTPLVFLSALSVLVSLPLATFILGIADYFLQLTFTLLEIFSTVPFALVKLSGFTTTAVTLSVVTALLMIVPVTPGLRAISLLLTLPLFFPQLGQLQHGDYQVTFLDVGQGTSVVVRTASHTLIYDTGDQFSQRFSAADAVLIPYLRSVAITTVDRLIVSHADRDHSGGADEVLDEFKVSALMLSSPLPQRPEVPYDVCESGESWEWDAVRFSILHPDSGMIGSDNDRSCVLRISTDGGVHTLLPGDIEAYAEGRLLRSGELQSVKILLSPHHGSATSSGRQFIAALQPEYVVHSTGFKNRFDFPREEVTARYQSSGARQFNTAESGAIDFLVSGASVAVSEYRVVSRRWWHRQ